MGVVVVIVVAVSICTYDYTKDEKGKDIEDKIDDHLLRP